ncbi:MAG: 30S ribosomal protein S20 [Parcubacteria group bacterium]
MPIKQASFKHLRQTKKRTVINDAVEKNVKKLVKNARKLLIAKKKAEAVPAVSQAAKALAKAARKGVIKKNTASRTTSRLMRQLAKLS